MNALITCSSVYGSSLAYAREFASRTGLVLQSVNSALIPSADLVIHFGGLYAGKMSGLKTVLKKLSKDACLIVVTVGIADPEERENRQRIESLISPQLSQHDSRLFCLRGCLDYSRLSAVHRAMMWALVKMIRRKEEKSAEDEGILATYGKRADFTDFSTLEPVEAEVRRLQCRKA